METTINDLIQNNLRVIKRQDGSLILSRGNVGTKSVSSPSAQSNIPCVTGTDWDKVCKELEGSIEAISKWSRTYGALYLIMFFSGCRVSEVLRLRKKDVLSGNYVLISASKHSENRVVQVPQLDKYSFINHLSSNDLLFNISRFSVYRVSVKFRLNCIGKGIFYDKPTKLFRYAMASRLYSGTKDLGLVARMLGHKNEENSKYYIYEKDVFSEKKKSV